MAIRPWVYDRVQGRWHIHRVYRKEKDMIQVFFDDGRGEVCREYPDECKQKADLLINWMKSRLIACHITQCSEKPEVNKE